MRPRLLTLAATASLLACVAVVAAWVRSYPVIDHWSTGTADGTREVWFDAGRIVVYDTAVYGDDPPPLGWTYDTGRRAASLTSAFDGEPMRSWHLTCQWFLATGERCVSIAGFMFATDAGLPAIDDGPTYRTHRKWTVAVPHGLLAAVTAALPAVVARRSWRRRRPASGCPSCGYDLRATPARCPECGTVTAIRPSRGRRFADLRPPTAASHRPRA